jgi:hypothetical protein
MRGREGGASGRTLGSENPAVTILEVGRELHAEAEKSGE